MKKSEIEVGMKVFRVKSLISNKTGHDRGWNYGIIISKPYAVPNRYRELWKVDVKFDNGEKAPVPLNMLKKVKDNES